MSFDFVAALTAVAVAVSALILGLGAARAFQIARLFVNRTYKLRAYWGGLLMLVILVGTLSGYVDFPETPAGVVLSYIPLGAILLFLLVFVDRGIFVAMDGDMFHRNVLLWRSARLVLYPALIISSVAETAGGVVLLPSSAPGGFIAQLLYYQSIAVVPAIFAYAVAALVIGGRRTADRTMKRHIRLLGVGFLCFIVSFPFFGLPPLGSLFANSLIIFANFFLYLSVMSLSSVGKLEKAPIQPGPAPPAGPAGTH